MPTPLVLIVDDDPDILRVMRRVIGDRAEIVLAMNAAMARECLSEGGIDVVLTDYNLPDSNGVELLTWLKATSPAVRRVLTTAGAPPELQAGLCDAFLPKPAHLEDMRRAVLGPWLDERP